jgi:predicted Holliday junction resolvase-like endonuclease
MKRDIIQELKSNRNLYAECPDGDTFPLHKAVIFYVDGPIPQEAEELIKGIKQELIERRRDVLERRKKLKTRSEKATESINVGKVIEKIAPALEGFRYDRRDCRALFEPIDYIIFDGLTRKNGLVDAIHFIDIKTGKSSLNEHQRQIKDAIESGRVVWDSFKVEI